jgi:ribosome recycling factor
VLQAGLSWRQVAMLRGYCKYILQTGVPFSQSYVEATFSRYPLLVRLLVELFEARFDPCTGVESKVAIKQTANLTVEDARTLVVTPWEKQMVAVVEKAIINSGLGLTPVSAGTVIRVPLPPMTEERRRELVRVVRASAESGRVAVRAVRHDALNDLKDLLKEKMITEDDDRRAKEEIQKLTDRHVSQIDALLKDKEAEIMEF